MPVDPVAQAKEARRLRLNGVLVVNKPPQLSSMGVVSRVRGRARGVRTGHAGTLDPLATGVLVLGLGRATKQLDGLMGLPKRYQTTIDLSITNDCFDLEHEARHVDVPTPPSQSDIESALAKYTGDVQQAPPVFSAIKIDGKKSYELARRDEAPELPERTVHVHELRLINFTWPLIELDIHCAKGFYVRSLARDLGKMLGTGGVCRRIHRSAIGQFTDANAFEFDAIPDPIEQMHLMQWNTDES
ncbi:MAG: tRNA pseudouridine(55) synthase TruB [Phycisphaerales bacterium]|nr:tRNA pseudouridine(55) synthase TruB [Phycisphaerales bacterium]